MYEDEQLDLPHEPGPETISIQEVRWRKVPVRLELTIWRPYEFSYKRYTDWMNQTKRGSKSYEVAWVARYNLQRRAKEPTPNRSSLPFAFTFRARRSDNSAAN